MTKTRPGRRLGEQDQRSLALWAADCAEHVLLCFEENYPDDDRPRKALEAARAAASAHMTSHARHAAAYAVSAAAAAVPADAEAASAKECEWQLRRLPQHLHVAVSPSAGES